MRSCLIAAGVMLGLFLLMLAIAGGAWVSVYSALNTGNQNVQRAWSDIGATMQRRYDLVPNLVQVVKGYATHEEKVFTQVAEARAKIGTVNINKLPANAGEMQALAAANGEMSNALSRLLVVAENYPVLRASEGFLDLQKQLEGTENRISVARLRYNEAVSTYNRDVNGLLGKIVAGVHGFSAATYYENSKAAEEAPKVQF